MVLNNGFLNFFLKDRISAMALQTPVTQPTSFFLINKNEMYYDF